MKVRHLTIVLLVVLFAIGIYAQSEVKEVELTTEETTLLELSALRELNAVKDLREIQRQSEDLQRRFDELQVKYKEFQDASRAAYKKICDTYEVDPEKYQPTPDYKKLVVRPEQGTVP